MYITRNHFIEMVTERDANQKYLGTTGIDSTLCQKWKVMSFRLALAAPQSCDFSQLCNTIL